MIETVRVADWLMQASEDSGAYVSPVLGEAEGELLFYALKAVTLDVEQAPMFALVFAWDEAYYSTSFFESLLGLMVDDVMFPYFATILRASDLYACSELTRLMEQAFDRIGLEPEVLA